MAETVSYTPEEVAKLLKITRFTVYEMIKRGDLPAYRIGRKMRVEAPDLEVYINKSKSLSPGAAAIPEIIRPRAAPQAHDTLIVCGQDVILDILASHLERAMPNIRLLRNYVGSMDGLLALYRGTANAVTAHLWDSDTDTYNLPYVRRFLPGHNTLLINLAYRMAGLYVAKGNDHSLAGWHDLSRPGIRLVNRERGAGARVLLDEKLRVHNIPRHTIAGYENEEHSHLAVASAIARGDADVGVGIEKVAQQVSNIDFIPLQKERLDLIIRTEDAAQPHFQTLLALIRSQSFRKEVQGVGGYDLAQTGEVVSET